MEEIIASVKDVKFDIETYIEHQVGIQPLPFPGMDSEYIYRWPLFLSNTVAYI